MPPELLLPGQPLPDDPADTPKPPATPPEPPGEPPSGPLLMSPNFTVPPEKSAAEQAAPSGNRKAEPARSDKELQP